MILSSHTVPSENCALIVSFKFCVEVVSLSTRIEPAMAHACDVAVPAFQRTYEA